MHAHVAGTSSIELESSVCLPLPGNQVRLRQARQATVFLACRLTCPLVLLLCFSHYHYRFFLFKNITTINLRNACEDGIHTDLPERN
jgi:hypothetical protein